MHLGVAALAGPPDNGDGPEALVSRRAGAIRPAEVDRGAACASSPPRVRLRVRALMLPRRHDPDRLAGVDDPPEHGPAGPGCPYLVQLLDDGPLMHGGAVDH